MSVFLSSIFVKFYIIRVNNFKKVDIRATLLSRNKYKILIYFVHLFINTYLLILFV